MALIKYISPAQELSGKVGGAIFQRGPGGCIMRGFRQPLNKRRAAQYVQRGLFSSQGQRWFRNLSQAQRDGWKEYAATCEFVNSLGDPYYLTGYTMYVRNQAIHQAARGDNFDDRPVGDGFPAVETLSMEWEYDDGKLYLTAWDPTPNVDAWFYFIVHAIRPVTWEFAYPMPIARTNVQGSMSLPLNVYDYGVQAVGDVGKLQVLSTWYFCDEGNRVSKPQTQFVALTAPP